MRVGLLWFDNSPKRSFEDRLADAVCRYQQKFGMAPNTCFVHPADLNGSGGSEMGGIRVVAASNILRHHLWIGREEKPEAHAA